MSKGIYLFWDNKYEQVIYAGRFTGKQRIKSHFHKSRKNDQSINSYIQEHPDRIESIIFCEFDDISDDDLNQLEKETIKLFKLNKYKYPNNFVFNFDDGGNGVCGNIMPEESKLQISQKLNKTGFFHVCKAKDQGTTQGFRWVYSYYINGVQKTIWSVDLKDLKNKVEKNNLTWKIIDKNKAQKSIEFEKTKNNFHKLNTTGIAYVYKIKDSRYKRGFRWGYTYYIDGKKKVITRTNLKKLEQTVKQKNLVWNIFDEEKAKKSYAEN